MGAAFIGLLGALVGLLVGSGYSFWSVRRAELEAAVVASSVLGEELRASREPGGKTQSGVPALRAAWEAHRSAFVCEMRPDDFRRLADSMRQAIDTPTVDSDDLHVTMAALTELFWTEHQALIVMPLINYLRRDTLSKRVHASLDRTLPDGPADTVGPTTQPPRAGRAAR